MRRTILLIATLIIFAAATMAQIVKIDERKGGSRIDILVDGRLFTAYRWGGDFYRPALYPIMSAGGNFLTRGFPFETRDGDTVDHPHQVGSWLAHASVNGIDFWNSSKFRSPKEMEKMGRIEHKKVVSKHAKGNVASLATEATWVTPNGKVIINERTRYTFGAKGTERWIDRDTILTAADGDVIFGDNKDGFFGLHLASELEQDDQSEVKVTNALGVLSTGRPRELLSGKYWNSEGRHTEKEIWGTRGKWAAVSGHIGYENVTLAIFDHPQNPLSPTRMMVRGYGLFALNPFGQKQFDPSLPEASFTLKAKHSIRFRYRILIVPGDGRSTVEKEYMRFTK